MTGSRSLGHVPDRATGSGVVTGPATGSPRTPRIGWAWRSSGSSERTRRSAMAGSPATTASRGIISSGGEGGNRSIPRRRTTSCPPCTVPRVAVDRPDLRERAVRVSDWELQVQLHSGALQSGMLREQLPPASVFQWPLGLMSGRPTRREPSAVSNTERPSWPDYRTSTYSRASWARCAFGTDVLKRRYRDGAERNVRCGLEQRGTGWAPRPGRLPYPQLVAGDRSAFLGDAAPGSDDSARRGAGTLPRSAPKQHDGDRPQHDAQVL